MIDLVSFISGLREQLEAARRDGQSAAEDGSGILFALDKATVELSIAAVEEAGGSGKLSFKVLGIGAELGGNAKAGTQATQKLTLDLTPVDVATGKTLLISKAGNQMPQVDD